jgi:hypothetical protein
MKMVMTLTLVLAIITAAGIGSLVILEVMTEESGKELLFKSLAVIVLLGACSALIALLTANRNTPEK